MPIDDTEEEYIPTKHDKFEQYYLEREMRRAIKEAKTMGLSDEQTIRFIMKNNNLSRKEVKFLILIHTNLYKIKYIRLFIIIINL